jgi:hypothetical protein
MVPRVKVELVERLLAEGRLSQRAIAREADVARATVARIARGECARASLGHEEGDERLPNLEAPPVRCGGCGGLVHPPCLLCRVRANTAGARFKRSKAGRLSAQHARAAELAAARATTSRSAEELGARETRSWEA